MCLTATVLGCSGLDIHFLQKTEKIPLLFLEASVSYNTSVDIILFKIYFDVFPEAKDVIWYVSLWISQYCSRRIICDLAGLHKIAYWISAQKCGENHHLHVATL
jgi:hypothetical protein